MVEEELEKLALSIVDIPQDFHKTIENYTEEEAYFSWTDEKEEEGITVKLDTGGHLTHLSIDVERGTGGNRTTLAVKVKQKIAEQFLLRHYPDALQHFTCHQVKELTSSTRFYYEQLVMNIPLERTGSYIDVNDNGEVVGFDYKGVKPTPSIPKQLISKEKLKEHVLEQLYFELVADKISKVVHDVEVDSLQLVYLPRPFFMKYKATEMEPTLTVVNEEEEPEITRPLPCTNPVESREYTKEELIGIPDTMDIIREVDWGDEVGIVWRERGWMPDEDDLSFEAFFKERIEQTVKAFISKETGKVRSFMWFQERTGNLQLGHEACFERALHFLQMVIPEFLPYLQYIVPQNDKEERKNETKQFFWFKLHDGHGTPVHSEVINIAVNMNTGLIDQYSGPLIDIQQLHELPEAPSISAEQALEIFKEHLDFELVWDKDYIEDEEVYELVYKACDRFTRADIRAIDAITGEVICAINNYT
ncbi:MAG: PepSY domain-containing protein [Lysinibacillus sp.]